MAMAVQRASASPVSRFARGGWLPASAARPLAHGAAMRAERGDGFRAPCVSELWPLWAAAARALGWVGAARRGLPPRARARAGDADADG